MTLLIHDTDRTHAERLQRTPQSVNQPVPGKQLSCVAGQGWPCLKTGKRKSARQREKHNNSHFLVCVQTSPPLRKIRFWRAGAAVRRPIFSYPGFPKRPSGGSPRPVLLAGAHLPSRQTSCQKLRPERRERDIITQETKLFKKNTPW